MLGKDKQFRCAKLDKFLRQCKVITDEKIGKKHLDELYSEAENGDCAFRNRCSLRDKHCADKGYDGSMYAKICRSETSTKESGGSLEIFATIAHRGCYTE